MIRTGDRLSPVRLSHICTYNAVAAAADAADVSCHRPVANSAAGIYYCYLYALVTWTAAA